MMASGSWPLASGNLSLWPHRGLDPQSPDERGILPAASSQEQRADKTENK